MVVCVVKANQISQNTSFCENQPYSFKSMMKHAISDHFNSHFDTSFVKIGWMDGYL